MFKIKRKKGFTLIELIVVMAVIGILVLLAMPKLMGHTKEAKFTKLISNTKQLENASERYYMDKNNWPRLTDTAYTSAQIEDFSQKIYDTTGKEVSLDTAGSYYDIDYSKLSQYIHVPDDKMDYIIQNPVGNVYALEGITKEAETRADDVKVTGIMLNKTSESINTGSSQTLIATIQPYNSKTKTVSWSSSNASVATVSNIGVITSVSVGSTIITATTLDGNFTSNCTITVQLPFTNQQLIYNGNYESWTVPLTGTYSLEVWGAQGGDTGNREGGRGGYVYGEISLTKNEILYVYSGAKGGPLASNGTIPGGWNGGGSGDNIYGSGGGATDIRTVSGQWNDLASLNSRIIVAGGGGSSYNVYAGGAGGLIGGAGQSSLGYAITGGTQTSGGSSGGTFGIGASQNSPYGGGGGGGGWYGGGSNNGKYVQNNSGGGGSSYLGTLKNTTTTSGLNTGNGKTVITYIGQ